MTACDNCASRKAQARFVSATLESVILAVFPDRPYKSQHLGQSVHTTHDSRGGHSSAREPDAEAKTHDKCSHHRASLSLCAMIIVQMHSCVARAVSADAVNAKNLTL